MAIGFKSIGSLTAERNLGRAESGLRASFERLSSGSRINKASDDAAGLSVSTSLNVGARVFSQGIRNINDGLSFLNVGEGALNQLKDITIRQKELATQSANGVYSSKQRAALQNESTALTAEYNRIVTSTQFNGLSVLDTATSSGDLRIQAGFGVNGGLSFSVGNDLARNVGTGTFSQITSIYVGTGTFYAVGDINGDGYDDLVVSGSDAYGNNGSQQIPFAIFGGASGPSAPVSLMATNMQGVQLADINGDSILDLVGHVNNSTTVSYSLGSGTGTFGTLVSTNIDVSGTSHFNSDINFQEAGFGLADIDNDGRSDIFTYNAVYLSSGSSPFSTSLTLPSGFHPYASTDIDGDGSKELVARDLTSAAVLRTAGNGSLAIAVALPGVPGTLIDLNGDGKADNVVTQSGSLSVKYGRGDGTFASGVTLFATGVGNPDFHDFNGDGILDVILNTTYLALSNADGSYATPVSVFPANTQYPRAFIDFDRDGVADVITQPDNGAALIYYHGDGTKKSTVLAPSMLNSQDARKSLLTLDDQLNRIESQLGSIGSAQSRLSTALSNLTSAREGYTASASRITDIDVAAESAELVRGKILQSVAAQVLGLANQQPSIVLKLLQDK